MFVIGSKIICKDNHKRSSSHPELQLRFVYTVEDIIHGHVGLRIKEDGEGNKSLAYFDPSRFYEWFGGPIIDREEIGEDEFPQGLKLIEAKLFHERKRLPQPKIGRFRFLKEYKTLGGSLKEINENIIKEIIR